MEERMYDLVFICLPATPEEEIAKIISTLEHTTVEHGGKVEKVEKWGQRKMAYRVAKQREGFYVYMGLRSSQGEVIKELERRLKVSDVVIKYMTIRLDEEIKQFTVVLPIQRDVHRDHLHTCGHSGGVGRKHDLEALS